jgi:hypothetical protein
MTDGLRGGQGNCPVDAGKPAARAGEMKLADTVDSRRPVSKGGEVRLETVTFARPGNSGPRGLPD